MTVTTEKEDDGKNGIWYNRGALASQAFAGQFENKAITSEEYDDPNNREVKWLSPGLLDACIAYIKRAKAGDGLRVVAYELTYSCILNELLAALERGVDVRIVYHATHANEAAIETAGLQEKKGRKQVLFKRTRPKTPHNKFIVTLRGNDDGDPVSVWAGSTNFTPSGFLGQASVSHLVTAPEIAKLYLSKWSTLKDDPDSNCVSACNFDPVMEWAPRAGQGSPLI